MSDILKRAHQWIAGHDTGLSSKAIWGVMMGVEPRGREQAHPLDVDDLGRCLRLLDLLPEWKSRLGEMRAVSAEWAALVDRWDDLEASMIEEVGIDWSKGNRAPRTYALMRSIRGALENPPT